MQDMGSNPYFGLEEGKDLHNIVIFIMIDYFFFR